MRQPNTTEATISHAEATCPNGHVGTYQRYKDGKRRCKECKRVRQLFKRMVASGKIDDIEAT